MLDSRAVLLLRIWMLLKEPLDFAQDFIKSVNDAIKLENPGKSLSRDTVLLVFLLHYRNHFDEQCLLDTF